MNLRYERKKPQNVECIHGNIILSPEERQTYYEMPQNSHCLHRKELYGKQLGRGLCASKDGVV